MSLRLASCLALALVACGGSSGMPSSDAGVPPAPVANDAGLPFPRVTDPRPFPEPDAPATPPEGTRPSELHDWAPIPDGPGTLEASFVARGPRSTPGLAVRTPRVARAGETSVFAWIETVDGNPYQSHLVVEDGANVDRRVGFFSVEGLAGMQDRIALAASHASQLEAYLLYDREGAIRAVGIDNGLRHARAFGRASTFGAWVAVVPSWGEQSAIKVFDASLRPLEEIHVELPEASSPAVLLDMAGLTMAAGRLEAHAVQMHRATKTRGDGSDIVLVDEPAWFDVASVRDLVVVYAGRPGELHVGHLDPWVRRNSTVTSFVESATSVDLLGNDEAGVAVSCHTDGATLRIRVARPDHFPGHAYEVPGLDGRAVESCQLVVEDAAAGRYGLIWTHTVTPGSDEVALFEGELTANLR